MTYLSARPLSLVLFLALATTLTVVPGCTYQPASVQPDLITQLSERAYPSDAPYGPDLDILVVRSYSDIRLINRTPHTYRGMELWLNQQYVADRSDIQIGTDNQRLLTTFINKHGEVYPVGNVLNQDKTATLVLAELYDPQQHLRYRLVVRPGNEATIMPYENLN